MHILESPLDDAFLSAEAVEGVEEEAALAPIIVDIPKPPMPSPPIINSSLRQTLHVPCADPIHPNLTILGHRGAPFEYFENTMPGFHACRANGAHGFELDVYILKCGTLIVFHGFEDDGKLDDYCLLPDKRILDYTYEEAGQLVFNPNYEEFPCPPSRTLEASIPTLEQVLMEFKGTGALIKVEMKGEGTVEPTVAMVEQCDMLDQVYFCSFDISRVKQVRQMRPQLRDDGTHLYKTSALFKLKLDTFVEEAMDAGVTEVVLRYSSCTTERVRRIHDAGMESVVWFRGAIGMNYDWQYLFHDAGNEDEAMYDIILQTGVRSLVVNRADVIIPMLKKRGIFNEKWFGPK